MSLQSHCRICKPDRSGSHQQSSQTEIATVRLRRIYVHNSTPRFCSMLKQEVLYVIVLREWWMKWRWTDSPCSLSSSQQDTHSLCLSLHSKQTFAFTYGLCTLLRCEIPRGKDEHVWPHEINMKHFDASAISNSALRMGQWQDRQEYRNGQMDDVLWLFNDRGNAVRWQWEVLTVTVVMMGMKMTAHDGNDNDFDMNALAAEQFHSPLLCMLSASPNVADEGWL